MMAEYPRLLYPRIARFKNALKYRSDSTYVKAFLMFVFGLLFWAAIFVIFYRVLYYFKGIDVFGDFLASKLLTMVLITFFLILIFSNVITAIATFFMSEELQLIISSPFDLDELYYSKLLETIVNSSWMVLLFSLPVFLSYGIIFRQNAVYYLLLPGTIIPYLIICGAIGISIALLLVTVFPARRLKDILFLLSIFLVIGLYFLLRFLRPERLVDPDTFFTVVDYLSQLQTPTSPFLPSQWATDVLAVFLFRKETAGLFFNFLLLWTTALAFIVILNWIFKKVFFNSWSKSQEARIARATRSSLFNWFMDHMLAPLPLPVRAIVDKDIRSFFRDTAQWSQLFILSAIIVIYLYNFSVLPMEKSPIPTIYLQNVIAFLNLGLAGFVISAVAVRFAYPAVSLEGESFWIIRSSPLCLKAFLWSKFWVNFILLAVLAEVLIVCSNYYLRVDRFMMIVSSITVFLMTFGLTSLSICFGASYPRFKFENVAQIPTGFGGLMYMMSSVLFVGLIVVLEARPVYIVLMSKFTSKAMTSFQMSEVIGSFVISFMICILTFVVPMRVGLKKLSALESF